MKAVCHNHGTYRAGKRCPRCVADAEALIARTAVSEGRCIDCSRLTHYGKPTRCPSCPQPDPTQPMDVVEFLLARDLYQAWCAFSVEHFGIARPRWQYLRADFQAKWIDDARRVIAEQHRA